MNVFQFARASNLSKPERTNDIMHRVTKWETRVAWEFREETSEGFYGRRHSRAWRRKAFDGVGRQLQDAIAPRRKKKK